MASFSGPKLSNRIADDVPDIQAVLSSLAKLTPDSGNTDYPIGTKRVAETTNGYEFQQYNGTGWVTLEKWNLDAQKVDGYSASTGTTANTIPVRNANGKLPGDILGNAATASKAAALSATNPVNMGGTGGTTAQEARKNLGTPPTNHASSGTDYGIGNASEYGHSKLSDATNSTLGAAGGTAATPLAVKTAKEEAISVAGEALEAFAGTQTAKDAAQDAAISAKVATVNGLTPDSNGNVDVGGMPLGTLIPYTGKDVPSGTLRADGSTYTNMRSSFPEFYEWVVNSGLTVPLGDYTLVEGSCGYYGLDTSTGTVRMPTLAAGVFGTVEAGKYGQAVQAGLPNITAYSPHSTSAYGSLYPSGAFGISDASGLNLNGGQSATFNSLTFDASRSNPIYGNSDTVQPPHVKYPWVIVVYNAAVLPSVAQAGEFIGLLAGKEEKGAVRSVNGVNADAAGNVSDIDSSGSNWIRYTNGIQICYVNATQTVKPLRYTFPKAFIETPCLATSASSYFPQNASRGDKTGFDIGFNKTDSNTSITFRYIAIGRWK